MACTDDSGVVTPPPDVTPPPLPPRIGIVDEFPAWSPDGQTVAYRRTVVSDAGPPGVYVINRDGTGNRLVLAEDPGVPFPFGSFEELRFSPGGRQLALTVNLEVFLLDLETKDLRQLTRTDHNARSPDWSPDGEWVVYSRPFRRSAELDSAGIYVVEVATGDERALFHDGQPVVGGRPRWSPQGEPIAFWSGEATESLDIFTVRSDGTGFRRLTSTAPDGFAQFPRWLYGGTYILYYWQLSNDAAQRETRVVTANGRDDGKWPLYLYQSDAISPDSESVVLHGIQDDSLAVLFVRGIDDVDGATLRQLTCYAPPPLPPDTLAAPRSPP